MTADLDDFARLVPLDHGLSVVVTRRPDLTPHTSVVNAGVVPHPTTGVESVAFFSVTTTRKLANLRRDPTIAVVVRAGWQWASVEGRASLIGPDDPEPGVDEERLRLLLREIFTAAGGTHDDWDEFDSTMRRERRTAVLVAPGAGSSRLS
jgi:PPOX class probable F420-dependent enzyme